MEILTKLFRAIKSPKQEPERPSVEEDNTMDAVTETSREKVNPILRFLNGPFQKQGYDHGYQNYSNEDCESNITLIKTRFDLIINVEMDKIKSQLVGLNRLLSSSSEVSEFVKKELTTTIKYAEDKLVELASERELCFDGYGLVGKALREYRIGFKQGTKDYIEEYTIAVSSGLFTNPK